MLVLLDVSTHFTAAPVTLGARAAVFLRRGTAMIVEVAEEGRYIHAERGFVVIHEKDQELGRIPLDTLTGLIISAQGATLSKLLLARLGGMNIPVVICGTNYLPISITTPVSAHYKHLEIAQAQVAAPESLKKEIWQGIVQAKLRNQVTILLHHAPAAEKTRERIVTFSRKVLPGDPDNYEANAARLYWPALFGKSFGRHVEQEGINAMLNYVYAVLRACVARAICAAGLLPLFGVHHRNKLNSFCLADDLMEPLRPLGDDIVRSLVVADVSCELTPQKKRTLCAIVERRIFMHGKQTRFIPATHMVAQSLAASFGAGSNQLCLPCLAPPERDNQKQAAPADASQWASVKA